MFKNCNDRDIANWWYQSWKQQMHMECPQLGNTIFVQFSMQIPHSSSLSRFLPESFLWYSPLFLLKTSWYWLLVLKSSSSINSPSSCLSEGYITAETVFPDKDNQKINRRANIIWDWLLYEIMKRRTYHKIPLEWLSFLLRKGMAFHQHIPKHLCKTRFQFL